jgi:ABC-type multidrug transport system fused ATPase/permease subunit
VLHNVFKNYRLRMSGTYILLSTEEVLMVLLPAFIGAAIDGAILKNYWPLCYLQLALIGLILAGFLRRRYDTALYSAIYANSAIQLSNDVTVTGDSRSKLITHIRWLRELIGFFERDVPNAARHLFSFFGSAMMLAWYYWPLLGLALLLALIIGFITLYYAKHAERINRLLNRFALNEPRLILEASASRSKSNFYRERAWRIRLSNAEAWTFGYLWLAATIPIGLAIYLSAKAKHPPGQIFAELSYLLAFIESLQGLPLVAEQWSKMRDIIKRLAGSKIAH